VNCEALVLIWISATSSGQDLWLGGDGKQKQQLPRQGELSGDREAICSSIFFWWPAASEESERAFFFFFSACAFSLLTSATARTPARLREEVGRACTEARMDCAKAILG